MKINYKNYQNEIVEIRRHFHMYPETAFKEFKTTKFIKNYLEEIGYNVEATGLTGCSAFLCVNKEFPTVVLRAEMDAVPITEESGEEFSSKIPNAKILDNCIFSNIEGARILDIRKNGGK